MNARPGELRVGESSKRRVVDSPRSLALFAVVIAVGLGSGFGIGSLVKGGGGAHHSPSAPVAGVSARGESIPVVPALHAIATLPALRTRPRPHPTVSSASGKSESSAPGAASSAVTPAPTPSSAPAAPSVSSTPTSASPAPRPTAPAPGEVHHESGGGA